MVNPELIRLIYAKTAHEERDRWLQSCKESLCVAYSAISWPAPYGVFSTELCEHAWCKGIVDVVARSLGKYF